MITNLRTRWFLKFDKQFYQDQFISDLKSIRTKYRDYGFLYARISNSKTKFNNDSSFVDIKITIDEEKQVKLGEIIISGNKTFLQQMKFLRSLIQRLEKYWTIVL